MAQEGYSIFAGTMVDQTWEEVEQAAKERAAVLWPLGVIEEHGPHMPLGVDIYNSYALLRRVADVLVQRQLPAIVAPPLYWGINEATSSFAGSLSVRPATLKAIIEDTFTSLRKDGFNTIYIITGHGERRHNLVILEGVAEARGSTGTRGFVVLGAGMVKRLGLTGQEPHVVVVEDGPPDASPFIDVHAGKEETSVFGHLFPGLLRSDIVPSLQPTNYGLEDLAEWRKGWENGRHKTPRGYFGDPAAASPEHGQALFEASAARIAAAIEAQLRESPWLR
ncbi:MAG TPA: creatininase family protein [Chloroflexota bacterium]